MTHCKDCLHWVRLSVISHSGICARGDAVHIDTATDQDVDSYEVAGVKASLLKTGEYYGCVKAKTLEGAPSE